MEPEKKTPDLSTARGRMLHILSITPKRSHYDSTERGLRHQPGNDWVESVRGEVCINHCSLSVDDIVSKHGLA